MATILVLTAAGTSLFLSYAVAHATVSALHRLAIIRADRRYDRALRFALQRPRDPAALANLQHAGELANEAFRRRLDHLVR